MYFSAATNFKISLLYQLLIALLVALLISDWPIDYSVVVMARIIPFEKEDLEHGEKRLRDFFRDHFAGNSFRDETDVLTQLWVKNIKWRKRTPPGHLLDFPKWTGQIPDFIVINPNVGIWILEVKHWRPETVESFNAAKVILKPKDYKEEIGEDGLHQDNPYVKTPHHLACVRAALKNSRSKLFERYGRLDLPVGWAVIYTNMYREAFVRSGHAQHVQMQRSAFLDLISATRCADFENFLYGLLDRKPEIPKLAPIISESVGYRPPVVTIPEVFPEHRPALPLPPTIPTPWLPLNNNSGGGLGWTISLGALALVGAFAINHLGRGPQEGGPQIDNPSPPRVVETFKEVATDCLYIRPSPSAKTTLGILPRGTRLKIVGPTVDGWEEVETGAIPASSCGPAVPSARGYVSGRYLAPER